MLHFVRPRRSTIPSRQLNQTVTRAAPEEHKDKNSAANLGYVSLCMSVKAQPEQKDGEQPSQLGVGDGGSKV